MPCKKYYEIYKSDPAWIEKRKEETKLYREANKELLASKHKEFSTAQFRCECGSVFSMSSKSKHNRCIKHTEYIKSLAN